MRLWMFSNWFTKIFIKRLVNKQAQQLNAGFIPDSDELLNEKIQKIIFVERIKTRLFPLQIFKLNKTQKTVAQKFAIRDIENQVKK